MNKTILLVLCTTIILGAIVSAADEIEVSYLRLYSDTDTNNVLDWDDDDQILYVEPGSTIYIKLKLKNNDNETIDVDFTTILYDYPNDGEEQEREEKDINIKGDSTETTGTKIYYIPPNQKQGYYNLEIEYSYDGGGESKTFEINVREKEVTEDDIILNLTETIAQTSVKSSAFMDELAKIPAIAEKLGTCESELAAVKANNEINEEFKAKWETRDGEAISFSNQLTTCTSDKQNMYTSLQMETRVTAAEKTAKRDQKKQDDFQLFVIIGGFLAWNYWKKKSEKVGEKGKTKPPRGKWG